MEFKRRHLPYEAPSHKLNPSAPQHLLLQSSPLLDEKVGGRRDWHIKQVGQDGGGAQ